MQPALSRPEGFADQPRDFHWLEKNIPCQFACPARTDIPAYLAAIARGRYDDAYRINLADNVFPAVLGRVCARPCEAACRHGWPGLGEAVAICFSKRSAADFQSSTDPVLLPTVFPPSGKRVAVIGGGVAGLTAARTLALLGHAVTVLEKRPEAGGMLRFGIPPFRLPREIVDREIRQIELLGIEIRCGVEVGRNPSLAALAADFDAVIVAAGTLKPRLLSCPGSHLPGVEHGLPFLAAVNTGARRDIGRRVAVIGGGFTALDCARVALRLGAESVAVYYRRSQEEILVTPGEREELQHEGIPIHALVSPVAFEGEADRVSRVRFTRTRLGDLDAGGRRRPLDVPGSEFEETLDHVLMATGQEPDRSWLGAVDSTRLARVFLAGDFATGSRTLIDAIGHARDCAVRVAAFLAGRERLADRVLIESGRSQPRARELDARPRQTMPLIPVGARTLTAEVETGLDAASSRHEAQRCYLCHYKYEIDMARCIYCDQCVEVKPRPSCIVKTPGLDTDSEGRVRGWRPKEESLQTGTAGFEYYINQADCIRCNACLEVCPVRCISVQKVSFVRGPRDRLFRRKMTRRCV